MTDTLEDADFALNLLEHGVYLDEARTLVISQDGETQVVLVLGDHYTMWSTAEFKRWANRVLKQL